MSEGWNIAVLGVLALWAKPCLKRWLNVSSRLGKFMHWHVTKAQANNCALVVRQSPCRMLLNSTDAGAAGIFCRRQRSYRSLG